MVAEWASTQAPKRKRRRRTPPEATKAEYIGGPESVSNERTGFALSPRRITLPPPFVAEPPGFMPYRHWATLRHGHAVGGSPWTVTPARIGLVHRGSGLRRSLRLAQASPHDDLAGNVRRGSAPIHHSWQKLRPEIVRARSAHRFGRSCAGGRAKCQTMRDSTPKRTTVVHNGLGVQFLPIAAQLRRVLCQIPVPGVLGRKSWLETASERSAGGHPCTSDAGRTGLRLPDRA
jgi:hypothetical protein